MTGFFKFIFGWFVNCIVYSMYQHSNKLPMKIYMFIKMTVLGYNLVSDPGILSRSTSLPLLLDSFFSPDE